MLKGLAEAAGVALSLVTLIGTAQADVDFPDQCAPDCNAWAENLECQAWFGPNWFYCGWANGWTYCCGS